MKNKLVVFDNVTFSFQKAGGVPSVCINIMQRVINSGRYDYLCVEDEKAKENIFREQMDIPDSKIKKLPTCLRKIYRYKDITIKNDKPFIYQTSYYRISKSKNARNVVIVHDFMYELFSKPGLALTVHKWQKYHAIRHATRIVCISENTKQDLFRFCPDVNPNKVVVIYNGVSDDYKPLKEKTVPYKDYFLVVGGRLGYKNFPFAVDAVSKTKKNLVICGNPLTEQERNLLNEKLGSKRYVEVINPSNEKLNELYNSAFCLAYPSSYEGFGIPVVEAQKAGCPVIAYNASSIPEIIGDTPLLMQQLTIEEFLAKVDLLQKEGIREAVITKGLRNAERFSWDIIAQQYMALYDEVLNE